MLLELIGRAGFNRVVSRVVGARCDFVDQQIVFFGQKHLDTENTHTVHRLDGADSECSGRGIDIGIDLGGRQQHIENVVAATKGHLDRWVAAVFTILSTGYQYREFFFGRNKAFDQRRYWQVG